MKPLSKLALPVVAVGLVWGMPALAQTEEAPAAKPARPQAVVTPPATGTLEVATDSLVATGSMAATGSLVATGSLAASPSVAATGSVRMKTSVGSVGATSSVAASPSAEPSGGFKLPGIPQLPIGIEVSMIMDGLGAMGGGNLTNTGGLFSVTETVPVVGGTALPALMQSSAGSPLSGTGFNAEANFLVFAAGITNEGFAVPTSMPLTAYSRKSTVPGTTDNAPTTMAPFFPSNVNEMYVRILPFKLGIRNEKYVGDPATEGDYTTPVVGLNLGLGLFDLLSANVGFTAGMGSVPSTLGTMSHMPVDGDVNLMAKLGPVRARVGYKAMAAVNAAPDKILTLVQGMANPLSLKPEDVGSVTGARYGLYMGPYLTLEVGI